MDVIDFYIATRLLIECTNRKCKFKYYIPKNQAHYPTHYNCPECGKLAVRLITNQEKEK